MLKSAPIDTAFLIEWLLCTLRAENKVAMHRTGYGILGNKTLDAHLKADHGIDNPIFDIRAMSIEDASELLWRQESIPNTSFSPFKASVLQELSARHNVEVGRSGKRGGSIKSDYVKALSNFVG